MYFLEKLSSFLEVKTFHQCQYRIYLFIYFYIATYLTHSDPKSFSKSSGVLQIFVPYNFIKYITKEKHIYVYVYIYFIYIKED